MVRLVGGVECVLGGASEPLLSDGADAWCYGKLRENPAPGAFIFCIKRPFAPSHITNQHRLSQRRIKKHFLLR